MPYSKQTSNFCIATISALLISSCAGTRVPLPAVAPMPVSLTDISSKVPRTKFTSRDNLTAAIVLGPNVASTIDYVSQCGKANITVFDDPITAATGQTDQYRRAMAGFSPNSIMAIAINDVLGKSFSKVTYHNSTVDALSGSKNPADVVVLVVDMKPTNDCNGSALPDVMEISVFGFDRQLGGQCLSIEKVEQTEAYYSVSAMLPGLVGEKKYMDNTFRGFFKKGVGAFAKQCMTQRK